MGARRAHLGEGSCAESWNASWAEPVSGIEPEPPAYKADARPIELRGQKVGSIRPRPPSRKCLFSRRRRFGLRRSRFAPRELVSALVDWQAPRFSFVSSARLAAGSRCRVSFCLPTLFCKFLFEVCCFEVGLQRRARVRDRTGSSCLRIRCSSNRATRASACGARTRFSGEEKRAPAQAAIHRLFVRVSRPGLFRLVSNERLYQLGYRPACGGSSRIRTDISIACMTLSRGRTSSNGRDRTFVRQGMAEPCRSSDALKETARVKKPF